MKILYLDCSMGASGDMLASALSELIPNPCEFIEKLNKTGINGVKIIREKAVKCGIVGTHISVYVNGIQETEDIHDNAHGHSHEHYHSEHGHEHSREHLHRGHEEEAHGHHHSSMRDTEKIISALTVPEKVKEDILAVYTIIADAESHVHGIPVSEIHFHEVGTMDAVADITAVCMLMDMIAPDEVIASPVHVGSGSVKCAHGILPVPAPATAYILKDIPIYGGEITGELCTPTGAALLKHFVTKFGNMPVMRTEKIGYGMGEKDFPRANSLRAMLGESGSRSDTVYEISCNVDDMTAEEISFASERLFENGAKEVFTVPIGMKKSRVGTLISVLCGENEKENIIKALFRYTSTIGLRETEVTRHILDRKLETIQTPFGVVRTKTSSGYGVTRRKYEYDDLARIAKENDTSIDGARNLIENPGKH